MAPHNQKENQESACIRCEGSGVLTVQDGPLAPMMKEAGVFCSDCFAGRSRWDASLKLIRDCEVTTCGERVSAGQRAVDRRTTRVSAAR